MYGIRGANGAFSSGYVKSMETQERWGWQSEFLDAFENKSFMHIIERKLGRVEDIVAHPRTDKENILRFTHPLSSSSVFRRVVHVDARFFSRDFGHIAHCKGADLVRGRDDVPNVHIA